MPQLIYNIVLALWLLADAFRAGRASLAETGAARWLHWILVLILVLNAWFAQRRRMPLSGLGPGPVKWWQIGWVLMAMAWPVWFTVAPGPGGPTPLPAPLPALLLQYAATLMFGASVYALGSSFAVFPERRAVVTSGVYRWLRHPMYASYLLLDLGFWLANPQPWFGLVWVVEVLLLEARSRWEEQVLSDDFLYVEYQQRVPWRLIPGLI